MKRRNQSARIVIPTNSHGRVDIPQLVKEVDWKDLSAMENLIINLDADYPRLFAELKANPRSDGFAGVTETILYSTGRQRRDQFISFDY